MSTERGVANFEADDRLSGHVWSQYFSFAKTGRISSILGKVIVVLVSILFGTFLGPKVGASHLTSAKRRIEVWAELLLRVKVRAELLLKTFARALKIWRWQSRT